MAKLADDADNRGNRIEDPIKQSQDVMTDEEHLELMDVPEPLPENLTIRISKALHRKLRDNARDEGISIDELISELLAEGVVLRAFEIVERKNTMRGGNQPRPQQNNHVNGNVAHGNSNQNHQQHRSNFHQGGGNRQAQKKLQRQARQHANAMDLLQDKAAFLEYVRNQEKKRR